MLEPAVCRGLKRRQTLCRKRFDKARKVFLDGHRTADNFKAVRPYCDALIVESTRTLSLFADEGYPDDWCDWSRDLEDAKTLIGYFG